MTKKHICLTLSVIVIALMVVFAVGCKGFDTGVLETPDGLKIENEVLSWNAVDGAENYVVDINGKEYTANTNSLDLFLLTDEYKSYQIKVIAYGDLKETFDSEWSDSVTYVLEAPTYLKYELINDGTEYAVGVTDSSAVRGKLILPDKYEGKPVTQILETGFMNCTDLSAVILPNNVTELNERTFKNCANLRSVKFGEELLKINLECFSHCTNLQTVVFNEAFEEIGTRAFFNCSSLNSGDLRCNLKTISNSAFSSCTSLKEIFLPETLETIGENAFSSTSLVSLNIPSKVKKIGSLFINNVDSLETLTVDESNQTYESKNNCIIKKSDSTLVFSCKTSVIPDTVVNLDTHCFSNYQSLNSITIPKNVKTISRKAFYNCKGLSSVTFENGLEVIEDSAFENCTALQKVHLPSSVNSLSPKAFYGCKNISELTVDESNPFYSSQGNCILTKDALTVVVGCAESVIPECVTAIGENAFYGMTFDTINIPESVSEIGNFAFSNSSIKTISLHDGITLGNGVFHTCVYLESVKLPNNLKRISDATFYKCTSLKHLDIPTSVEEIGSYAFAEVQAVFVVPKTVSVIGAGAFQKGSTIYTDVASRWQTPQNWFRYDNSNFFPNSPFCDYSTVVYGCELGYDDGVPYVISYTYDNLNTMSAVNIAMPAAEIPRRKGYVFKGWAKSPNGDVALGVTYFKEKRVIDPLGFMGGYIFTKSACYVSLTENDLSTLENGTKLYAVWEKEE